MLVTFLVLRTWAAPGFKCLESREPLTVPRTPPNPPQRVTWPQCLSAQGRSWTILSGALRSVQHRAWPGWVLLKHVQAEECGPLVQPLSGRWLLGHAAPVWTVVEPRSLQCLSWGESPPGTAHQHFLPRWHYSSSGLSVMPAAYSH